jgi:hypothetical protein
MHHLHWQLGWLRLHMETLLRRYFTTLLVARELVWRRSKVNHDLCFVGDLPAIWCLIERLHRSEVQCVPLVVVLLFNYGFPILDIHGCELLLGHWHGKLLLRLSYW